MDTSPVICAMEGWSQGGLGLLLTASALIFAVGLMVYLRYYMGIVFVLVGAIALYYGWPVLEDIFNFHPDCVVVNQQFAQEEGYANNTLVCQRNLIATDNQTGEDCFCNGQSATAQCVTYNSVCTSNLATYETSGDACTCGFADSTQNASPACEPPPPGGVDQVSLTNACTTSTGGWVGGSQYCANTTIPHDAQFIAPVANADNGQIVGNAYYTEQTSIDNTTGAPVTVTWYGESDNSGWYFINGQQVGYNSNWSALNAMTITLQPGVNTLDVTVWNSPQSSTPPYYGANPSGTVDEVVGNSGTVYSATGQGQSWQEVAGPPTTPSPPPSASQTNCYTQNCSAP
ncbi:hypothetical protein NRY68_12330 [Acidithiobacillus ferrooxidans]|uniref:hypothetical protein n=1 Tax=Acidithiobacillus ferrooxidans TaxID=920 RepID=UPI002148DC83|nr:hypothetical protein [Acidithiobacillus ferrooxidans]MCR1346539.1 hypothetical protein [Acidithiobacillus ferrooxidans]MCR1354154.1 hypothetical protein [Acidithiobacillus ferrooxidans]